MAEQRYLIEPLSEDGDHAVFKYEEVTNTPAVCGVTNTTWEDAVLPPSTRMFKSRSFVSLLSSWSFPNSFNFLSVLTKDKT